MREKQTYENTITSKLEALPLPNLEDAIWARIEFQLDIDMPTGDDGGGGGTPPPKSPISFGWFGGLGLFCVVAILISIFTLSRFNGDNSSTTTREIIPVTRDSITESPPSQNRPSNSRPNAVAPTASTDIPEQNNVSPDTATAINAPPPQPVTDSFFTAEESPPISISPPKDSAGSGKRPRGVKGITEADYKIVPKSDTTRRGPK